MLLMDPRGRALVPLELFRDAADRFGFVLLSSYNTLSDADSAYAVNDRALAAMLADAQTRFSVDPKRLYLVGFSGTAHWAWTAAPRLDGKLAGIMGAGGGLPAYLDPMQRALGVLYPFAFFGTAGSSDFNFDGVRLLDQALDSTRFAHRFIAHDGDHGWPPKPVAEAAVEWFHLQAMSAGLEPRDESFIGDARRRHLTEAADLESSDRKADAYRRYREIVQDFAGLGGSPEARKRFDKLDGDGSVERALARRVDFARDVQKYKLEVRDFYLDYRESREAPSLESALRKLRIEKLKKQAESDDIEKAAAAKRMLAGAFVNTAFYEPRDYFQNEDFVRAMGMLQIANAIQPDTPRVCYQIARAAAQLGSMDEAFKALACGLKAEWATKDLVDADDLLEPLRADPRYGELIRLLPRQEHHPGFRRIRRVNDRDVDSGTEFGCVEGHAVPPCVLRGVAKPPDLHPKGIEHGYGDVTSIRKAVLQNRCRIERIGVILPQSNCSRDLVSLLAFSQSGR